MKIAPHDPDADIGNTIETMRRAAELMRERNEAAWNLLVADWLERQTRYGITPAGLEVARAYLEEAT